MHERRSSSVRTGLGSSEKAEGATRGTAALPRSHRSWAHATTGASASVIVKLSPHTIGIEALIVPRPVQAVLIAPKVAKQLFLCRISTAVNPTLRRRSSWNGSERGVSCSSISANTASLNSSPPT